MDELTSHKVGTSLGSRIAQFNAQANKHVKKQAANPFSTSKSVRSLERPKFTKEEYGRPVEGSKSDKRGKKANVHITKEILELCEVIHHEGIEFDDEGVQKVISFGDLFNIYVHISNKVVGTLLRGRKHGFVDFEGEVLFQRRDDDVPIILLQPIEEIRKKFKEKLGDDEEKPLF